MNKREEYFIIARLITEEINGSLTKEDQKLLEIWSKESPENLRIYKKIKEKTWYANQLVQTKKYNNKEGWKKIEPQITDQPNRKQIFISISKIAATVIILLAVAFLIKNQLSRNTAEKKVAQVLIAPGGKSAKLIMDNGTVVPLSSGSEFSLKEGDGTTINKQEGVVRYIKNSSLSDREIFNTLITVTGEEYTLMLSDGTKVTLNAESQIKFPVVFIKNKRTVEVKGEAYFEVSHDARHPFVVKTNKSVIQVLGTSFNIKAYNDEPVEVATLVEGNINIRNKEQAAPAVILNPGEQALVTGHESKIKVEQVNTTYFTTWKDGNFVFKNERLEDIVRTLKRWYHFDVEFKDENAKNICLGARINRYSEADPIFEIMNNTLLVKITRENNKIIIESANK